MQQWLRDHCSLLWHSHWSDIRLRSKCQTSLKCAIKFTILLSIDSRGNGQQTEKWIRIKVLPFDTCYSGNHQSVIEKTISNSTLTMPIENIIWIFSRFEFVFQLAPNSMCSNNIYLFARIENELAHYTGRTHMFTLLIQYSYENYAANYVVRLFFFLHYLLCLWVNNTRSNENRMLANC